MSTFTAGAPSVSRSTPRFEGGRAARRAGAGSSSPRTLPRAPSRAARCSAPEASQRDSRRCIAAAASSSRASRSASSPRPPPPARRAAPPHRLVPLAEHAPPEVLIGTAQVGGEQRGPAVRGQPEQPRAEPADHLLVERRARAGDQDPRPRAFALVPARRARVQAEPLPHTGAGRLYRALGPADRDANEHLVVGQLVDRRSISVTFGGSLARSPRRSATVRAAAANAASRASAEPRRSYRSSAARRALTGWRPPAPSGGNELSFSAAPLTLGESSGPGRNDWSRPPGSQLADSDRVRRLNQGPPIREDRRCAVHSFCWSRSSWSPWPREASFSHRRRAASPRRARLHPASRRRLTASRSRRRSPSTHRRIR